MFHYYLIETHIFDSFKYFRRFDQTFMDIKELLSSDSLGTLQALKTTTRDSPKPSYEFLMTAGET